MIVKTWGEKKKVKVIHEGQKQVIVPGAGAEGVTFWSSGQRMAFWGFKLFH